jgi:phosphatidylinositol phospholipase C delta
VKELLGWKEMASYEYKMFGFSRKFKMGEVGPPADVKEAFSRFAGGGDHMSVDQFLRFLVEHQGEVGCTASDAGRFVERVLHERHDAKEGLSLANFFHFLFLDDLNGPIRSEVTSPSSLCNAIFVLFVWSTRNYRKRN